MATETLTERFVQLIENCTKLSVDDLLNNSEWGAINFEECRPEVELIYWTLNQFKGASLELLPQAILQQLMGLLPNIRGAIYQIHGFSIKSGNPNAARNQLVAQIKSQADQFFNVAHPYILYIADKKGDVQRKNDELTRAVEGAVTLWDSAQKEAEQKRKEVDSIVAATRDASASVGVAHFSADFSAEAETQSQIAGRWLWATGALALITIATALAMVFFISVKPDATTPQVIQLLTSKVVILGMLFTATVWSGRLYKAARHQSTINKHRANALRTFQAFTKAASDDAARNAVLMETTKSIFAITPSGYLESESAPDGGLKIVEVLKHATQTVESIK